MMFLGLSDDIHEEKPYNVVKIKTDKKTEISRSRDREVERKRKVSRQGFERSEG